ncbi:hypothetical protein [Geminocystis sp. NIES-3709]|uniref:hypothetical protein n=1 Tax=Geminocystis sp. NIES-3709 TaxID=1617448 RepID=UPI0005FC723B|nr:hypothetical protein [Geminocystis sp. NIES-3709]BAQ67120.1 hypothetical protein GM3709_3885 [Geminocystis sp. NIES-3709]
MQRDKSKVEKGLLTKGFRVNENDHHYFIYYTQECKKTTVKTKTSHTKKMKTISDHLLSQMAKQCRLTKSDFLDLIDCPLTQDKYEQILKDRDILK